MTSKQLAELRRLARLGRSLPEIARACRTSRQRVYQVLLDFAELDQWRETRKALRDSLTARRTRDAVARWLSTDKGTLILEAAKEIEAHGGGELRIETPKGCPPHITVGSRYVRLLRPKRSWRPSEWNRQQYHTLCLHRPGNWCVAALPDGRVAIYEPQPKRCVRYILADASVPPRGDAAGPWLWLRGEQRRAA